MTRKQKFLRFETTIQELNSFSTRGREDHEKYGQMLWKKICRNMESQGGEGLAEDEDKLCSQPKPAMV